MPGVCAACGAKRDAAEHAETLLLARRSIPERFRWATMPALQAHAERVRIPAKHLEHVSRLRGYRTLVLYGPSGKGKTSLACALLRAVIDAGAFGAQARAYDMARRARFLRALDVADPEPLNAETDCRSGEWLASNLPAVVLDDVAQEAAATGTWRSDERSKVLARALARRHDAGHTTIVTTFADRSRWAALYGDGVARRYWDSEPGTRVVRLGAADSRAA